MSTPLQLFRLNVEVGDLSAARVFYEALLGGVGRGQAGNRFYLDAGPVALQVVEVPSPHTVPKALYFATDALDAVHTRAAALGALAQGRVHGHDAGSITVQPWGERSFYAADPWGNPLCFVEAGTEYRG
jgi:catechol 2,3-dioxygenase-like lactoylglutathione lyase family enzyme